MYRKSMFSILFSVAVVALFIGCATQQKARPVVKAVDLNAKMTSGQLVQKVDAFEVIFDATLSMNDVYKNKTKLKQEKALVALFNDTIPDLKLSAAARAFGQFKLFGDSISKLLFGPVNYSKPALPKAIAPFKTGYGLSPLDESLDGATADLRSQSGKMAVIAFSDGEDMEKYAPVAAARRMKSAYGDRICIYTVHIGESVVGRKLMQQVADAGQCGFMVTGDSISTPAGMADFVEKVFMEARRAEPAKRVSPLVEREIKVAGEAAPAPEKVSITLNVQFDTNKANIKPKYHQEIKKAADFMIKYPSTAAVIEGHTDSVGKKAANMKLSQRRADSIKAYLVKKFGINKSRIKAVGYGPDKPIASNATKEGRQKNRRVTAVFSNAK